MPLPARSSRWLCEYQSCSLLDPHLLLFQVLKKDAKKNKKEEISIEDLVERERAALGPDLPKITLSSFLAWKKQKIEDRRTKAATDTEKRKAEFVAGKSVGLSGREMFTFNPLLVGDDQMEDGETAFDSATREDLDPDDDVVALDFEKLAAGARDADGSGTVSERKRLYDFTSAAAAAAENTGPINEELFDDEEDLLSELEEAVSGITVDD